MGLKMMRFAQLKAVMCGVALLLSACGTATTDGADALALPDVAHDLVAKDIPAASADDATVDEDAAVTDIGAGTDAAALDAAGDTGPTNAVPHIKALAPLTLAQGASTTLDVNPLLADLEDSNDLLKLVWSAQHVAVKDPGTHVLYIVAPTTWIGTEPIDITVRDTGGATATETLYVTVTEVKVDPPKPAETCGKVVFSIAAGTGQHTVLLSGSFNGWGKDAATADVMTDSAGKGAWTVTKTLTPGVYQYKFVVDGKWQADANNPNQVPDGYGGKNSVVEVPTCTP